MIDYASGADGGAVHALPSNTSSTALLTDLYQLTMMQAYYNAGMTDTAVFEFFVRKLPTHRNFFMAAGLEPVLDYLQQLRFSEAELQWLNQANQGFDTGFLNRLKSFRFTGDVDAMPEGAIFFPHEPILRVTAPLPEAQFVETRIVNLLHLGCLIASKAARFVLCAKGKALVDFGLRRAHGAEAGLMAARAAYIAGFDGTATVLAGACFGIPVYGTMAHSFIQAHDSEALAFERFAHAHPDGATLLVDTYDTEAAVRLVAKLAPKLLSENVRVAAIRIDSGDLGAQAQRARAILDEAGLQGVRIVVSGGLDEFIVERLATSAPIDGFGVGTSLVTSQDAPGLDCAYKLQEYAGQAKRKRSEGKATWPGRKQVLRTFVGNVMSADLIALEASTRRGTRLLEPVLRQGMRVRPEESLKTIRMRAERNVAQLPVSIRSLTTAIPYSVDVDESVRELAREVDAFEYTHRPMV